MGVKVTKDKVNEVLDSVRRLTRQEILVGIPGENAGRKDTDGKPVTNVVLGYVHEFGDPARNIPARPFLVPGVRGALPRLIPKLKKAGQVAIDLKNISAITKQMIDVGNVAATAVQMKITNGPFAPIAEMTKRGRLTRKESYKNASAKRKATMMTKWMAGNFKPLIDTGAMRQAITFVIRPK